MTRPLRILIAPGAFKHSLSAQQAAQCIRAGLERSGLDASLELLPIADGGNSFLDSFCARGARRIEVQVQDALGSPRVAAYGMLDEGTAVIEMAQASGLEGLPRLAPLTASTFGTGELLQAAWQQGARRFLIGLGGSATTDGGAGCLRALGVRFCDAGGETVTALERVQAVDASALAAWSEADILLACDVQNPVVGPRGAAMVFAPQKGASLGEARQLDEALRHFFGVVGPQVLELPGGGAAGGLAAGLVALLGARIVSGIELVLDEIGFDHLLAGADLVITGEGQLDEQTLGGKGPHGVALRAARAGVPTVALVGSLQADETELRQAGFAAVVPLCTGPMSRTEALERAESLLEKAALRLGYLLQLQRK